MRQAILFGCAVGLVSVCCWAAEVAAPEEPKTAPETPSTTQEAAQAAPETPQGASSAAEADKPKTQDDASKPEKEKEKKKTEKKARATRKAAKASKTDTSTEHDAAKVEGEKEPAKSEGQEPAEKSAEKKSEEKAAPKKATIVCFAIRGEYPEGPSAPGLFGELQPSLGAVIRRIDAAAADKDVAAVWLKIENAQLGRGKVHELRAAVARVRNANKPVYAELTTATAPQYLVASACDQVIMPPSGMLIIPGVRAEVTFFKGLLDKLGIEFDALQMGKYKGAIEPYTRTEMSPPLRESIEAIVDDIYQDLAATIGEDRKLLDFQVKALLDHGLFTAEAAKKAGLIDELIYADEFQEGLKKKLNVDELNVVTAYKRKRIDTDFSGISGMMKFMEMLMGGKPSADGGKKPKIALVYAVGPILEGKSTSSMFSDSVVGSSTLVAALRKAAENPKVSAVVLRIDSPGGSAVASDLIWRETVHMQKPVIASMGDVAGSGGYYIAMGAKKIIAAPGTLTGSIGVVGGKPVTRGLYGKVGLNTEVISRGANSGSLSLAQPFTPDERKAWMTLLEETYHQFVSKAAEGRKMPCEKLEEIAQGRVYTGRMAKRIGLVDELGTLDDAVTAAKVAAGLKPDAEVDLLMLPEPRSFFEQVFGDPSAATDFDSLLPEPLQVLRQVGTLRQMLSEPILLWMPYEVRVR